MTSIDVFFIGLAAGLAIIYLNILLRGLWGLSLYLWSSRRKESPLLKADDRRPQCTTQEDGGLHIFPPYSIPYDIHRHGDKVWYRDKDAWQVLQAPPRTPEIREFPDKVDHGYLHVTNEGVWRYHAHRERWYDVELKEGFPTRPEARWKWWSDTRWQREEVE